MSTVTEKPVDVCERVTSRISRDMAKMRESTADAALNIGQLLGEIVRIATEGNQEIKESLGTFVRPDTSCQEKTESVSDAIDRQTEMLAEMIGEVKHFFDRQLELSNSANAATQKIYRTAGQITQLMRSSRILALNLRIESSRLGKEGQTFAVLGDQMKVFSDNVAEANEVIATSVEEFVREMPKLQKEAQQISDNLSEFTSRFDDSMGDVKKETQAFSHLLDEVIDGAEARNNDILKLSHDTLSHLQFQDPVSQGLRRAEHDVQKLLTLFKGDELDDRSLADLAEDVGNDGREVMPSGDVMLF